MFTKLFICVNINSQKQKRFVKLSKKGGISMKKKIIAALLAATMVAAAVPVYAADDAAALCVRGSGHGGQ